MQTAFHILSLVKELSGEIIGGKIAGTEYYRKDRAFYLIIKKKQRLALGLVYHPVRWGSWLIPASKLNIETREKPRPVFDIEDASIIGVEQHGLDRIFSLKMEKKGKTFELVFEALGPNGNVWLLDEKRGRRASLRRKEFSQGETYSSQPMKDRLNPIGLTAEGLAKAFDKNTDLPAAVFLDRNLLGCNETIAREIAHRAEVSAISTSELTGDDILAVVKALGQIVDGFRDPGAGYLYTVRGKYEAYPFKLSFSEHQPERFKTLSLAVMTSAENRDSAAVQEDEEKVITDAVKKAIKRLEKRIANVEKDISQAANYEQYQRYGDLLKINFNSIKKGMTSITVVDEYLESREKIEIQLDPALTPNENAESYFKRYRKGREGLGLLERRLEISKSELAGLAEMQSELERNFEAARQRFEQDIMALLPKEASATEVAPRLPYKTYTLSTGLTIFVGRDGADNDRTTFEFARPYELWFHTQQCAGSHVVMKFPNKSFEPSKREIEETAAIAAHFSKARNDTLVPVIYTERKYVRKPRKAKPGLVTVEREKSVMVEPTKPDSNTDPN